MDDNINLNDDQALLGGGDDDGYIDPGQFEGTRGQGGPQGAPQNQNFPQEGGKRWNQLYAQKKEGDRKLAELEKRQVENEATLNSIRQHNQSLMDAWQAQQNQQGSPQQNQNQPQNQPQPRVDIQAKVSALVEKRNQAYKDDDLATAAAYTDQINDIKMEAMFSQKPAFTKEEAQSMFTEALAGVQAQNTANVASAKFAATSPWFDEGNPAYDKIMAMSAAALEGQMANNPQWSNPGVRLAEVKRVIEERFAWKPAGSNPVPTNTVLSQPASQGHVESGGGVPPTNGNLSNSLTDDERTVARGLFPGDAASAERAYLKQKNLIEQGR
jgi:hypothetical protein